MSQSSATKQNKSRWQRRKEERPSEILSAALKVFSAKGFAASKLDEVAKEAGLSKGTLYLYFESKDALFKAVVTEFVIPEIAKAEQQAQHIKGSVKAFMSELLEQWRTSVLETELSGISKMMIAEATNFPELANFYLENVVQRMRNFVVSLIELGIERGEFQECDSKYAARVFLSSMVFSAIWKHSLAPYDEDYDVNKYLRFQLDIFLRGISKEQ